MIKKYVILAYKAFVVVLAIHNFFIEEKRRVRRQQKAWDKVNVELDDILSKQENEIDFRRYYDDIDCEELRREEEKLFRAWMELSDRHCKDLNKQRRLLVERLKANKRETSASNTNEESSETTNKTHKQETKKNDKSSKWFYNRKKKYAV